MTETQHLDTLNQMAEKAHKAFAEAKAKQLETEHQRRTLLSQCQNMAATEGVSEAKAERIARANPQYVQSLIDEVGAAKAAGIAEAEKDSALRSFEIAMLMTKIEAKV